MDLKYLWKLPCCSSETSSPPHPLLSLSTVYCCCCLANVSLPGVGGTVPESKPFFYVNVADIEMLETEVSYVACKYLPSYFTMLLPPLPSCLLCTAGIIQILRYEQLG